MTRSTTINVMKDFGRLRLLPLLVIATACAADPAAPHQASSAAASESDQSLRIPAEQYRALEQVSVDFEELVVSVDGAAQELDHELRTIWSQVERAGLYSQPLVAAEDDGSGFVDVTQESVQDYVSNLDAAMPLMVALSHREDLPAAVKAAYSRLNASMQGVAGAETASGDVQKARHHYYCVMTAILKDTICVDLGTVFEAWAKTKCAALVIATGAPLRKGYLARSCP